VTVASTITKDLRIFGHDEKQTDDLVREFIRDLVPELHKASAVASSGQNIPGGPGR